MKTAIAQEAHELVDPHRNLSLLMVAAVLTLVLWRVPFGNYVLYPFSILATWFHEMGHGLTALALGGGFKELHMFPDGSGMALHSGAALGSTGRALVAAGGPLGPAVAGGAFIVASRNKHTAHVALDLLGLALILSAAIWVRSLFGIIATVALGVATISIAARTTSVGRGFFVQFLGMQACLSCYRQIGYLFTHDAVIGGQVMLSDSGQIANNLWLPYWFWGATMAAVSFGILAGSLRMAYAAHRAEDPTRELARPKSHGPSADA